MNNSTKKYDSLTVGECFEKMTLTRNHWVAGGVIFVTFVIEAWEMLIVILSAGGIAKDFGLETHQIGTLISAIFLGMIPGSLIWGKLSATLGRKKCLIYSIGGYAIFPIMSAYAPTYEIFWIIRFLAGVVLAGALVVSFPLFMEILPVSTRGRATVLLSAGWPVGTLVAVAVTYSLGEWGWRTIVGFSSVAAFWMFAIIKFVPESPYWLAERGDSDGAAKNVAFLSRGGVITKSVAGTNESNEMPFLAIFSRTNLKITLLSTVINFCFAWGYWGMTSWLPKLLSERGLNTAEGLEFIALSAIFMFPGYLMASYLTGIFGRKKVMVSFVALSTVMGIGFGLSTSISQMYFWNFGLSFFSLGAWGIWNTWQGEIYDTASRGAGVAWGVMLQRVANTIAPIAIGFVLAGSGFATTILFISMFLAVTFICSLFLKETEGAILT